jgi:predicted dehydrogenase
MEKLRVGIIGTGGISHMHIDGYRQLKNVDIVSGCDIDSEKLDDVCKKYAIPEQYTDHRDLLEKSDVDVVSICTSHDAHAEIAINALKAGKHVLLEKPMAITSEQARQILDASKESGKVLMIGFVRRFGDDADLIMDLKNQGLFGDIYYVKASYLRRYGFPGGWFGNKAKSGGGPLIDLGVHCIDLCRYLMGNPKPLTVSGSVSYKLGKPDLKDAGEISSTRKADIFNVEDMATLYIKYDNGAVFYLDTSFCLNIKSPSGRIEIFGDKAGAKIEPDVELYTTMSGRMVDILPAKKAQFDFREGFRREIKHFVECVTLGIPCKSPGEDGLMVTKIIEAGYKSAETGREICF